MAERKTKKITAAPKAVPKKTVSPEDEQKLKEMKEMETVPLVEKDTRQINLSTSWIFFAATLLFLAIVITLLYNLTGQITDLKTSMNTRFEAMGQHINVINTGLRGDIETQSSFCYGYDQNGKIGGYIDDRKMPPCAGVNATR